MFEYEFVRIDASHGVFGRKVSADYQQIVHQRAAEGWRLTHILSAMTAPSAFPANSLGMELIFERPKHDDGHGRP